MDMDFAVSCPLVRHSRLISGFCPSTRTFDPCFFRTPPRGGSPCISLGLHLHQVGRRTCTSTLLSMPSTQLNRFAVVVFAAVAWSEAPLKHWIWVYRQIDQPSFTKGASHDTASSTFHRGHADAWPRTYNPEKLHPL